MGLFNKFAESFRNWLSTHSKKDAAPLLEELLEAVLAGAADLGLSERDIQNAEEMLHYDEYFLGFEIVIAQLHENEIEIPERYFSLLEQTAKHLQIPEAEYAFVKELIRSPNHVPKPVGEKLSLLLQTLKQR